MADLKSGSSAGKGLCSAFKYRHVLVLNGFIGVAIVYLLRVNLNVAIVTMTVPVERTFNASMECPHRPLPARNAETKIEEMKFKWSSRQQGLILGSFFWGYLVISFIGGTIAEIFGAKLIFGLSILIPALLTLLTPVAAAHSITALISLRVLEGGFEGLCWPAMHTLCGRWLLKSERGFLYSIIHTGAEFGSVVGYPIAGALCGSSVLGGWPAVFYIFGSMGILWFVFWWAFVFESPSTHPRISLEEKQYIQNNLECLEHEKVTFFQIPWFNILTSVPLWAVAWTSFFTHWAFEFIFVDLSLFLHNVLYFDIQTNGLINSLPHLGHVIVQWTGGYFADFVNRKGYFSRTNTRKGLNLFSCLVTAVCFIGVIFARCDSSTVIILIIVGTAAQGLNTPSFIVALLDMAPTYAGTLMGLTNGFGSIASFVSPMVAGVITEHGQTLENWHKAFYISAGVSVLGGITFTCFGSSELQSWAIASKGSPTENSYLNLYNRDLVQPELNASNGKHTRNTAQIH